MSMKATRCIEGKILNSNAIRQLKRTAKASGKPVATIYATKSEYFKAKKEENING